MNKHLIKHGIFFPLTLGVILAAGCSSGNSNESSATESFKLRNFESKRMEDADLVYLMCNQQRPIDYQVASEHPAGDHVLWVKALVEKGQVPEGTREAYFKFETAFEGDKTYVLQREKNDDTISVWIAEEETARVITEKQTQQLMQPAVIDRTKRLSQCREGTV